MTRTKFLMKKTTFYNSTNMNYRTQFVIGDTSFYYTGFRSGCFSNDLWGFSQSAAKIWSNQEDWDGRVMWHVWERVQVHTRYQWGNLKEGGYLNDRGVDAWIILKWILEKWNGSAWTGSILLRRRTCGGLLWMRQWTFVFHKTWEIWVAEDLSASQEGLRSMGVVSSWS